MLPDVEAEGSVDGHPGLLLGNHVDNPVTITCCAECGRLRTVLWLVRDRWFCTQCKATGETRPTVIPIN